MSAAGPPPADRAHAATGLTLQLVREGRAPEAIDVLRHASRGNPAAGFAIACGPAEAMAAAAGSGAETVTMLPGARAEHIDRATAVAAMIAAVGNGDDVGPAEVFCANQYWAARLIVDLLALVAELPPSTRPS